MYPDAVLLKIYREHGQSRPRLATALLVLGVPTQDARLLARLPWRFATNRVAVQPASSARSRRAPAPRIDVIDRAPANTLGKKRPKGLQALAIGFRP